MHTHPSSPLGKALSLVILLMISVAFLVFFTQVQAQSATNSPPALFVTSPQSSVVIEGAKPTIFRTRMVEVDFNLLEALVLPEQARQSDAPVNNRIRLNLFDDVQPVAVIERRQANLYGSVSWFGYLENVPFSTVILVTQDGLLTGHIAYLGGVFEIEPLSGATHAVHEINQAGFPPEQLPARRPDSAPPAAPQTQAPLTEDGSFIDVMVIYTDDARAAAGSTINVKQRIQLAIDETNQSYGNSGITQRVRLVYADEISYAESGNSSTDVTLIRNGTSPFNGVATTRNNYAADVVVLIVNTLDGCGRAYGIMDDPASFSSDDAYVVVALDCATGYYSFGHELGHIMGARHDWFVDDTKSPRTYSHAHVNVTQRWRTVMGYNDVCGSATCQRIIYWSNPDINYTHPGITPPSPAPLGIPEGTNSTCTAGNSSNPDCDADNRKTLNLTAVTVANFRQTKLKSTVYVNAAAADFGSGTSADPYQSIEAGVGLVLPNGTVYIAPGSYNAVLYIVRPMTLRANGSGTVTIGQ